MDLSPIYGSPLHGGRMAAARISVISLFLLLLITHSKPSQATLRDIRGYDTERKGEVGLENQVEAGLRRRAQVIEVRRVHINLTLALHYIDDDAAASLDSGNPENLAVQRFCGAVNQQAGGSQARKSAEDDSLTLFTRNDYEYPETGCEILGTNKVYSYGVPPGPKFSSLEIFSRQEVFVSPIGNISLYDDDALLAERVALHINFGFDKGSGGRARFRRLLKSADPVIVAAFHAVEDVDVVEGLGSSVARPTAAPSAKAMSASPTMRPPGNSAEAPTTDAPTVVSNEVQTLFPGPSTETKTTLRPSTLPFTSSSYASSNTGLTSRDKATPTMEPFNGESTVSTTYRDDDISGGNSAAENNSEGGGPRAPMAAIAAAAGAGFGILVVGFFTLWRCKSDEDGSVKGGNSCNVLKSGESFMSRGRCSPDVAVKGADAHPPAPPSATSSIARLGARRAPPVPSVVDLPEGGEVGSVANSTLGDRTAGRKPPNTTRPPISILRTTRRDGGGGASSIAASSQISSLGSGTIGAGGDRTVGGFSVEAAIKEATDGNEEDLKTGAMSGQVKNTYVEKRVPSSSPSIDEAAAGAALLSSVFVLNEEVGRSANAPSGGVTPTESLAGTTSLMAASYQSTIYSSSQEEENLKKLKRTKSKSSEVFVGIEASSDGDVTPRASGMRVTNLNIDLENDLLFPLHNKDRAEPSSYLPSGLVGDHPPERPKIDYEMNSPPPPSIRSSSERQSSWSDLFAAGTAAILSASFEQATSDDADDDEGFDRYLGINKPLPLPINARASGNTTVPILISNYCADVPPEKEGCHENLQEFPDSRPSKDANSSDDRVGSEQGTLHENNGNISSNFLRGKGPTDWAEDVEDGMLTGNSGRLLSDAASALSSIPPPPPGYPPSPESAGSKLTPSENGSQMLFRHSNEYSLSDVNSFPRKHISVIPAEQHGGNNVTQPADVAAGPSSQRICSQSTREEVNRKDFQTITERGLSRAVSVPQTEIDWALVAEIAATKANLDFTDEVLLETPVYPSNRLVHPNAKTALMAARVEGEGDQKALVKPITPTSTDDYENGRNSSSSSGLNTNPWLIDAVAEALCSNLSSPGNTTKSAKIQPKTSEFFVPDLRTESAVGSRASPHINRSFYSSANANNFESEIFRQEAQVKATRCLSNDSPVDVTRSKALEIGSKNSPTTPSPTKSSRYNGRRNRISIEAPPGRLGVILANRSDGRGTVVSALRTSSPLAGQLSPGDRLEAIDGEDVSEMKVSDVTAIMARKADRGRTLTVVTPGRMRSEKSSPLLSSPPENIRKSVVSLSPLGRVGLVTSNSG